MRRLLSRGWTSGIAAILVIAAVTTLAARYCSSISGLAQSSPSFNIAAIGIDTYYQSPNIKRFEFGVADADAVRQKFDPSHPGALVLEGKDASRTGIVRQLQGAVDGAREDRPFLIFISAHGVVNDSDGCILAYDSDPDRCKSTAVPVSEMKNLILSAGVQNFYLFADLCREPNNDIHNKLRDLNTAKNMRGKVRGILAARPPEASQVSKQNGAFAEALLLAMGPDAADIDTRLAGIFQKVSSALSSRGQVPLPVGSLDPRKPATLTSRNWFVNLREFPVGPALFLFQQSADPRANFGRALKEGRLLLTDSADEWLKRYNDPNDQRTLAIALEDVARRRIATYGAGEQFQNDPFRLTEAQFREAGDYLQRASELVSQSHAAGVKGDWSAELQPLALFCSGRADILAGKFQQAETTLSNAIQQKRDLPESHNALGVAYLDEGQGKVQSALPELREAAQLAPQWAYARHNLALAYMELGDYRSARREIETGMRAPNFHPYLAYDLGILFQRQHRLNDAARSYKTALDLLVQRQSDLQATEAAINDQGEAARIRALRESLHENQGEVENALGTVYENQKKIGKQQKEAPEAVRSYQAAIADAPDLLEARHNLALYYMTQKKPAAAIQLWTDNLAVSKRLDPAHPHQPSLFRLGEAYRQMDQYDLAIQMYRQLPPDHVEAAEGIGLALAKLQRNAEAIAQIENAEKLRKDNYGGLAAPEVYETLGDLYAGETPQRPGNPACGQYRMAEAAVKAAHLSRTPALKKRLASACAVRK